MMMANVINGPTCGNLLVVSVGYLASRFVPWNASTRAVQPTLRLGVEVMGLLCFRRAAGPILATSDGPT
jgi:hypothetical protein